MHTYTATYPILKFAFPCMYARVRAHSCARTAPLYLNLNAQCIKNAENQAFTHAYKYEYMYACMFVCLYVCACVRAYTRVCACRLVYADERLYLPAHARQTWRVPCVVCRLVCVCVCVCVCMRDVEFLYVCMICLWYICLHVMWCMNALPTAIKKIEETCLWQDAYAST